MAELQKAMVTGVQHVGMGVRDLDASRKFYVDVLGCTKLYAEFGKTWNCMSDFFRTSPHMFDGFMYQREEAKGIIVECIKRWDPPQRPIHAQIFYGDIGVNKMTIEVANVEKFVQQYKDRIKFLTKPQTTNIPGWGDWSFVYGADPDGNLIEFAASSKFNVKGTIGSIRCLGLSVTDLDRSMAWYQKYVDYDKVVIPPHESFSGLMSDISGSRDTKVRSCVLANSNGNFMAELYEVSKPRGRAIPMHTMWADYGYLEIAHYCDDVLLQARYYSKLGCEFHCAPSSIYISNPDYSGLVWFMYIKDPDGIPVEFLME